MPQKVNGPTDGGKDEDRPHDKVKKRIKFGVVCQVLWLLFSHDEKLLRRTGKCSRSRALILSDRGVDHREIVADFLLELPTGKSRNGILWTAKRIQGA